ncbi:hypothetical protein Ade02nite_30730 [Paractinoplanes deccanensis]|uniref:N-acetyltransferase domain-containing protein n=1 Tax=Paractinoplanes deccanensis TaxID=113561 RepID=A0ABQ3Y370_9ACTN|nr:GNAT family N-acetyltransferase [Actinoplanes deccanensis]GID74432.1 hypothetical protein Ade02nite_30730 [Actinoplanes deccanensis]
MAEFDIDSFAANLRDFWLAWGNQEPADDDPALLRTGVPHPFLNGVLRLESGRVADVLPGVRRRFDGLPWLWHVGPDSDSRIGEELVALAAAEPIVAPVMAIGLDDVAPSADPAGLKIEGVAADADLAAWAGLYSREFGFPEEQVPDAIRLEFERQDPPGTLRRYAGRVDGVLVATASVLDLHGVAGVYCVATHHDWQRQGIGARMMTHVLSAARDRGLTTAVLESSPDGLPLYRKLGFTQVAESRWYPF